MVDVLPSMTVVAIADVIVVCAPVCAVALLLVFASALGLVGVSVGEDAGGVVNGSVVVLLSVGEVVFTSALVVLSDGSVLCCELGSELGSDAGEVGFEVGGEVGGLVGSDLYDM